uniref:Uncharacterized protein n=1 Tax=Psilocybe cubensis TaxID=181762 RepID=A0A8H8CJG7_PSICU
MSQSASSNSNVSNNQRQEGSKLQNSTVIAAIFSSEITLRNSKEDQDAFITLVRSISDIRSEVKQIESLENDNNVLYGALLVLLRFANSKYRFPISKIDGWDLFRTAYMVSLRAYSDETGVKQPMTRSWNLYVERRNKAINAEIVKGIGERMDWDINRSSATIRGLIPEFRGMLEDDFATNKKRTRFGYPREFESV